MLFIIMLLILMISIIVNGKYGPDCKKSGTGLEYHGQIKVTKGRRTCQSWTSQWPHVHDVVHRGIFPDSSPEEAQNFCRNPDNAIGLRGPWCYTLDVSKRWEYCRIPRCPQGETLF